MSVWRCLGAAPVRGALLGAAIVTVGLAVGCATGGGGDVRGGDGGGGPRFDGGPRSDGGALPGADSGATPGVDAGGSGVDAGGTAGTDAGGTAGTDAGGTTGVDAGGGGSCTESPCRLVSPQCGCAPGQACYLSGATRVCGAAGAGGEGASCAGSSSCSPGLDCIDFSAVMGGSAMQCARYCAGDADCMGTGSICIHDLAAGGARVCSRACDPIRQTGCAPGLMCNIYQESAAPMRFLSDCTGPTGSGSGGSFCTTDNQCAPGSACVDNMCLHWCNVATDEGCVGFEFCASLTPRVVLGGIEYGFCI